jgi:hypothetical protein
MRLLLTKEEIINIVATLSEEDIRRYSEGNYKKWKIKEDEYGDFNLEYIYDDKGNLKEKEE